MRRARDLVLAVAAASLLLVPALAAADPIAIGGVGASSHMLPNGNTQVRFTVRVETFTSPLEFNYHWERSDGAKSAVKTYYVRPGTRSVPITTTWSLGPGAAAEVWQKLFVNTGNTHLQSEPVKYRLH